MRAAVMNGSSIAIEEVPDPTPASGQLVIAPTATGICGSDLHFRALLADLAAVDADASPSIVPGHEFAGAVVAVGPDTDTSIDIGALVTALPFTHGAAGPETIGLSPTAPGGLAEYVAVDAVRTHRLPDGLDGRLGALAEPIAVAVHAFSRAAPDGPIAVIGAGPIGLGIISVAAAADRRPIIAVDPSASHRAMATRVGADSVHEPGADLTELLVPHGFTPGTISPLLDDDPEVATVFECVGVGDVVRSVIAAAPPHSRVILAGACPHDVTISPMQLTLAEVTVDTSFAYRPRDFRSAIGYLHERPDRFRDLITSDYALEETGRAFDALAGSAEDVKVLIHPSDRPPT